MFRRISGHQPQKHFTAALRERKFVGMLPSRMISRARRSPDVLAEQRQVLGEIEAKATKLADNLQTYESTIKFCAESGINFALFHPNADTHSEAAVEQMNSALKRHHEAVLQQIKDIKKNRNADFAFIRQIFSSLVALTAHFGHFSGMGRNNPLQCLRAPNNVSAVLDLLEGEAALKRGLAAIASKMTPPHGILLVDVLHGFDCTDLFQKSAFAGQANEAVCGTRGIFGLRFVLEQATALEQKLAALEQAQT